MTFAKEIACPRCDNRFPLGQLLNLCACGSPLLVRYDLKKAATTLSRAALQTRAPTLWRYREVLPLNDDANRVSLGEGFTPLLEAKTLARERGLRRLWIKDEAQNPTGSFKDRGLSMAISMAKELGVTKTAIPSAGNAGKVRSQPMQRAPASRLMSLCLRTPLWQTRLKRGSMERDSPWWMGSSTTAAGLSPKRKTAEGWFDVSTLKEPYRVEGKKTMGYEIAEQLNWKLPDVIIYPTGGGTGLIGMWKAFAEMEEMGWLGKDRPRMVSVQASGCAPIVRAFDEGKDKAEPWQNAKTVASGLRVPQAVADFLMLGALRRKPRHGVKRF